MFVLGLRVVEPAKVSVHRVVTPIFSNINKFLGYFTQLALLKTITTASEQPLSCNTALLWENQETLRLFHYFKT